MHAWYSKLTVQVKWCGTLSSTIEVGVGTRQGGLSSPFLFNLFYQDLISLLSNCSGGIRIQNDTYKETDDTISVVDSYCLTDRTKDRATHSYKVTIRCDDVSNILSANFWPDRIGCQLFEKRSRDPATPVPKKDNNGDQA